MMLTIKTMLDKIRSKTSSQAGMSLVETLVALTIASLALIILAMAISVTSSLADRASSAAASQYSLETQLAEAQPSEACTGTISVTLSDGTPVALTNEDVDVSYVVPSEPPANGVPIVSYTGEVG